MFIDKSREGLALLVSFGIVTFLFDLGFQLNFKFRIFMKIQRRIFLDFLLWFSFILYPQCQIIKIN